VRIDRSDDGDERQDAADVPRVHRADAGQDAGQNRDRDLPGKDAGHGETGSAVRVERALEHRTTVDAVNRAYAIDQGYARVQEIEEKTVTPAMRRIEAEDPDRRLVGLENRLKGKDRLTEKIAKAMSERSRTPAQAFAETKDAIRYTLQYPDEKYVAGVAADVERLKAAGFVLADPRNWWEHAEYKGINSWWRVPETDQLFEVQFHTRASYDAKQETHEAYERIRSLPPDHRDVYVLHAYQREVTAKIPIPPGAPDIRIS
jgi:hypothetical protein